MLQNIEPQNILAMQSIFSIVVEWTARYNIIRKCPHCSDLVILVTFLDFCTFE